MLASLKQRASARQAVATKIAEAASRRAASGSDKKEKLAAPQEP